MLVEDELLYENVNALLTAPKCTYCGYDELEIRRSQDGGLYVRCPRCKGCGPDRDLRFKGEVTITSEVKNAISLYQHTSQRFEKCSRCEHWFPAIELHDLYRPWYDDAEDEDDDVSMPIESDLCPECYREAEAEL